MSATTAFHGSDFRCPYCRNPSAIDTRATRGSHCGLCGGSFDVACSAGEATLEGVRKFGRFQLDTCVGQGSYGAVWRAWDTSLARVVALKIPHPNFIGFPDFRERVKREARSVAGLRHSGIVPLHEVVDIDGVPVLVSDFIDGASLKDLQARRQLTFREAGTLVADVADALDHAHAQGLIHRDVKPANILIETTGDATRPDSVGKAVVVDFGVALREEAEVVLTADGQIVGTPRYMSPEQACGRAHLADRRSDVYSLGVVLYELLCSEPPFRGTRTVLLHQVVHEPPRPPRKLNDRIPKDLETICLKALAKEPGWRYQTAADLAADLRRHLRGEPVLARPLGPALRFWLWCRRNRPLAVASGLAAAAIVGLFGLSVAFALREHHNALELAGALHTSNAHLREAELRLADSHINRGLALCEQQDVGQGQLWLARAMDSAPEDAAELRRFLQLSLSAWESRQCSLRACVDHPEPVRAVAFVPGGTSFLSLSCDGMCRQSDPTGRILMLSAGRNVARLGAAAVGGSTLVTGHGDGTVWRWALPGLDPINPVDTPLRLNGRVSEVAVARDGATILACGVGGVVLWKTRPGGLTALPLRHEMPVRGVAVSGDGRFAMTRDDTRTARLWDAATGEMLHTLTHDEVVTCGAFTDDGKVLVTGSHDGGVRLWETNAGKALGFRVRHSQVVRAVAISPDGRFILSGSSDRTARLWSVATQELAAAPLLHTDEVKGVAFAADGLGILTAAGKTARLWSPPPAEVSIDDPDGGWVRSVAFSPDGLTLLCGGGEFGKKGTGRLWDCPTGKLIGTPLVHTDLVAAAAFGPNNRTIATGGFDGAVRLADSRTGRAGALLPHRGPVLFVAFSPDGDLLLTGGEDRCARLWDPESGRLIAELPAHAHPLMVGGFSPSGDVFFAADHGGGICVSRTSDRTPIFPRVDGDPILAAAFSHDGSRILVGAGDQARLFDRVLGLYVGPPLPHPGKVRSVAFCPGDRLVVVAGDDGTAQLWDLATGTTRFKPFTHRMKVITAVFSPDGGLVLTGSEDGTARLWDVGTGRAVGPAIQHRGQVTGAAFSRDGRRFATGSSGRTSWLQKRPVAWEGDPASITLKVEVLSGMKLDARDQLVIIDTAEWREKARRLEQQDITGGP